MEIVVSGGGEELYSKNLRYFLRIEEDNQTSLNHCSSSNSGESHRNSTGLTSSAVLSEKGEHPPPVDEPPLQRVQSNRTLLDIIREDHTPGLDHSRRDGRRRWRHLKDKIRLRRRGNGLPCSSDSHLRNNHHGITMATRPPAIRFNSNTDPRESTQRGVSRPSSQRNPTRTESASGRFQQTIPPTRRSISEDNHQGNEVEAEAEEGSVDRAAAAVGEGSPDQSVRTSLMALLAENDRQMDFECAAYIMEEDEKVIEEERGGAAAVNGGECNNCCICMVRHKGAAFIPCGHTFCRLCSRELWVQRGNCPLCNNYILEILDIF